MPSRIQTKGIGSRPSWFKQANSYIQTSLCLRDNLACKLTPVFSASLGPSSNGFWWSPSNAPWFWWSNFGCIATTLPAFVSGEMAGWVHRDSKRVKPMEKKSLYKKPQYLKSSKLSNFDPSDLKIQKSITGDTCFKALEAFGFGHQKKRHKHYILIPIQVSQRRAPSSALATRIIKKQGALNKKNTDKAQGFLSKHFELCSSTSATKLQDVSTFMHHWDAKLQFICFPDLRVFWRRADFPPSLHWF